MGLERKGTTPHQSGLARGPARLRGHQPWNAQTSVYRERKRPRPPGEGQAFGNRTDSDRATWGQAAKQQGDVTAPAVA